MHPFPHVGRQAEDAAAAAVSAMVWFEKRNLCELFLFFWRLGFGGMNGCARFVGFLLIDTQIGSCCSFAALLCGTGAATAQVSPWVHDVFFAERASEGMRIPLVHVAMCESIRVCYPTQCGRWEVGGVSQLPVSTKAS